MKHIPITWLLVSVFLVTLGYLGPAIDDYTEQASAAEEAAAQQRAERRLAETIKRVCGTNAAGQLDGSTLQCFTHKGKKTIVAQVAP